MVRSIGVQSDIFGPKRVGQRLCRALMEHSLAALHEQAFTGVMLWVLEGNERAIRFYEGCGFVPDGHAITESIGDNVEVRELRYRKGI